MSESNAGTRADLVLTGGHVIDPANGINGPADVAIGGGKIVAVGPGLSTEGASGCWTWPGTT
ncbi:MAG: hypothetical protein ACRDJH_17710 [Thermomicrobiales bacterium]